jgi:Pectinesterase
VIRHLPYVIALVGVVLLFGIVAVTAQGPSPHAPQVALGTGFTYQGQLKSGGAVINATCGAKFGLWDSSAGGAQVSGTTTQTQLITVTNGLFTTSLDFGPNAFNGDARYLAISVACPSGGAYTDLSPREPITPAPYALTALKTAYKNVLVVAKSGGHYNTISAALTSISDNSTTNRYLIWVAPGTYTEVVTMKDYVDIEGAGELQTKITFTSTGGSSGTVNGAPNTELRFLTVENTGGAQYAIALYNPSRVLHVTVAATGGFSSTYAVNNYYASPTLTSVNLSATQAGMVNGTYAYGVYSFGSNLTLVDSMISANGGYFATGAQTYLSTMTVARSTIHAAGGLESDGIFVYGYSCCGASPPYTTTVSGSQIFATNFTVRNDGGASTPTFVAESQMAGVGTVGSNIICAGVYDRAYVFHASTCQ